MLLMDTTKTVSPQHVRDHVDTVARHEKEFLEERSTADCLGDGVAGFAGSLSFIAFHLLWIGGWLLVNTGLVSAFQRFDPPPFPLLAIVVAIEAVFLASFILMRQNRMTKRTDQRDHLMLQMTILVEKEVTKLLQIQRKIAGHMGLEDVMQDKSAKELSKATSVDNVVQTLKENIP
jgi:uncharacterized membrane protein